MNLEAAFEGWRGLPKLPTRGIASKLSLCGGQEESATYYAWYGTLEAGDGVECSWLAPFHVHRLGELSVERRK
eukprot:scaffold24337_cov82-Cyclotella_meneghiniana.AAC.1